MITSRIDVLLLAYATGSLGRYRSAIVIIILTFNPSARKKLAIFEQIGGELITQQEPAALSPQSLEEIIKAIDKL